VVPPIPLIPVVLMKIKEMVMKRIQIMVTIVVLKWQGQPWFQLLKEMVVETMELEEVIKNNAMWKFKPRFIALRIFGQSEKDYSPKKQ
jgi:glycogen synthase